MPGKVEIAFDQLIKLVRDLPSGKLKKLKAVIERQEKKTQTDLTSLLLNGPVATKKQLEQIALNRKAIDQWRIR